MTRAALLASVLVACAPPPYQPPATTALCWSAAERAAQARFDAECLPGEFQTCPSKRSILLELQAAQEACP